MRTTKKLVQVAAFGSLLVATVACGSDSNDSSSSNGATSSVAATDPATTDAPAPTTTELVPAAPQLRPLDAGGTYRLGKGVIGRSMSFTTFVDGTFAYLANGFFGATLDKTGTEVLMSVTDLARARVFTDPVADLDSLNATSQLDASTTAAPSDFLAYFATLPSVIVGPIETTEFAGFPARSMSYSVGSFDGGFACFGSDRGACLLSIYVQNSGVVQTYWDGDSGTLYELTIDGRTVLVDVSDREGAAETAASLVIGD